MKEETKKLIGKLSVLKQDLSREGFMIDGLFGSYARGDFTEESDIDLLYHIEAPFMQRHPGFSAFYRLDEIKRFLTEKLGKKVDLAPMRNLSKTGKRFILPEMLRV